MPPLSSSPELAASVPVDLGDRSYCIHVGPGLLERASELIPAPAGARTFVITHPAIDRLHGERLRRGLHPLETETIHVPPGERQKSLRRAAALYDELLSRSADRRSIVIAFGGGVIGDLAGFVAATYMRGVVYTQAPTTLLAQVDASVGGKVAVNHPRAKNLIGAFYQPTAVIADSDVLGTLSARDYRAGLAEVVKHAVIADAALFAWLRAHAASLMRRDAHATAHIVRRSCEIKADVVRRDERETGLRATLNFGHTVGHALETEAGYRALRHGEAVAIGMVAASRLAQAVGLLGKEACDEIERLLDLLRLPVRVLGVSAAALMALMRADKKAAGGAPRFVLPRSIGAVEVSVEVPEHALRSVLVSLGAVEP